MREKCQCCGQPIPVKPILGDFHLSTVKRRIWDAVTAWPGMTSDELLDWVYGHDPKGGPDSGRSNIHVNISQMNKRLRSIGYEIRGHAVEGYRVREVL